MILIEKVSPKLFLFVCFLVIVNLLILDLWILNTMKKGYQQVIEKSAQPQIVKIVQPADGSCPVSCLTQIKEATASLKLTANQTIVSSGTPSSSTPVKEVYIPIGSGTASNNEWEDVKGLKVYIDTTKYSKIKSAVFEASVSLPSGNQFVYVRLYNETDKHPVWFSELYFQEGTLPALQVSQPIVLDAGNKLYKVQMKTQLKSTAAIDQSRVHLTLE